VRRYLQAGAAGDLEVAYGLLDRAGHRRYPSLALWRCAVAYALVEAAREDEALVEFERQVKDELASVPRDHLWTTCMAFLALTCAALHDSDRAVGLYELLLPYARYNNRMTRIGVGSMGPIAHYLGLLAATVARWEDAAGHFETAMQMSTRMAAPPLSLELPSNRCLAQPTACPGQAQPSPPRLVG
jgi:hypothetical protein